MKKGRRTREEYLKQLQVDRYLLEKLEEYEKALPYEATQRPTCIQQVIGQIKCGMDADITRIVSELVENENE